MSKKTQEQEYAYKIKRDALLYRVLLKSTLPNEVDISDYFRNTPAEDLWNFEEEEKLNVSLKLENSIKKMTIDEIESLLRRYHDRRTNGK